MNSFFANLKIKDWTLIFLSLVIITMIIIGTMSSSGYKKQIREFEKQNREIENKRSQLELHNQELSEKLFQDSLRVIDYQQKIDSLNNLIFIKDGEIKSLKVKTERTRKELEKTKKEIDNLINNPVKRTGDELLNSLKEKTN
jgi:uncharacterized membrane-anchored protein YhcB (DUF1043 family)